MIEWVLWFSPPGTEQAVLLTPFENRQECEEARNKLRMIKGVVFDCWERKAEGGKEKNPGIPG